MALSGLGGDVARLHHDARVDRGPEIVDLDLAGRLIDRDLGDARRERVVLVQKAMPRPRPVALALPVRHLGDRRSDAPAARGWPWSARAGSPADPCRVASAISSRKHSIAKALWPAPTPRHGKPRAAQLDDVLGALVRDAVDTELAIPFSRCGRVPSAAANRGGAATQSTDSATTRWCQATILPLASRPASMTCCVTGRELAAAHVVLAAPESA